MCTLYFEWHITKLRNKKLNFQFAVEAPLCNPTRSSISQSLTKARIDRIVRKKY